jgi:hypothetical protein
MATSRRLFTRKAAFSSALAASLSRNARAAEVAQPSTDLIRVGAVALGDASHNENIWPAMINAGRRDKWPTRTTRMLITHAWDSKPEVTEHFARTYGCEPVKRYDDMVGKVDAMIFGGFYEVKWWPELVRPYLEAGIPCFINRPFAYSMKAAKDIVATARKYNTPILCTDEREYTKEAVVGRNVVEKLLRDGKTILGGNSQNATVREYPMHAVHGLYYTLAMFGTDVEHVSYQADGWWNKVTPSTDSPMNYGLLSLQFRGVDIPGIGTQEEPFLVSQLQLSRGNVSWANMRIFHDGGWTDVDQRSAHGGVMKAGDYFTFFPTVVAMQRMFETREMPWSYDYILQKTKIFIAGFKSHLEHDGAMIRVDDLPDDWEAPSPYPDWIDESIFM